MGSHGRGFIERALLGSVTLGVLNRTHIPVLAAKKPLS
ncbi:universal stress protein [Bacillus smithii]